MSQGLSELVLDRQYARWQLIENLVFQMRRARTRLVPIRLSVASPHVRGSVRWSTGLLGREAQVRILPGAPFSKEFADFVGKKICRRSFIEQSDQSCEFAPWTREFMIADFAECFAMGRFRQPLKSRRNLSWSPAWYAGGRFTVPLPHGIVVHAMTELRELRRAADLSQCKFAGLMSVPVNTFRMWDSGLRPVPTSMLLRARSMVADHARQTELLPLAQLARELHVHVRTLQAAARTGRLQVTFSSRSAFGRPIGLATRAAGQVFMRTDYRRYGGQSPAVVPLPSVPDDYDARLKRLRRSLRLTQDDLARRIGAANKAVVYQRTPSPVFWKRVEALGGVRLNARRAPTSSIRSAKAVLEGFPIAPHEQYGAER
jgi:DNA-binding transcriptional regulator YiaG